MASTPPTKLGGTWSEIRGRYARGGEGIGGKCFKANDERRRRGGGGVQSHMARCLEGANSKASKQAQTRKEGGGAGSKREWVRRLGAQSARRGWEERGGGGKRVGGVGFTMRAASAAGSRGAVWFRQLGWPQRVAAPGFTAPARGVGVGTRDGHAEGRAAFSKQWGSDRRGACTYRWLKG